MYSDYPVPNISGARAVAKWAAPLKLVDLSFSPDGQSLAVLSVDKILPETEGIWPGWLSVVDLDTNAVQPVPAYPSNYSLYEYAYYRAVKKVLGWLDNSRLVVQQSGEGSAVVATKDGSSYSPVTLPQGGGNEVALSADRNTLFSNVVNTDHGLWLNNIDGSNPRQVVGREAAKQVYEPKWSPDSKYVSFLSPKQQSVNGTLFSDFGHIGVWLLNPTTASQQPISGGDVWDVDPAWSIDSSKLAFLRADNPIGDDNVSFALPEKVSTNIYTADVLTRTPYKLTNTTDVKNSSLQWSAAGNLVLSSTAGSTTNLPGLLAVSTANGASTTLISGDQGEALVHPVLARP